MSLYTSPCEKYPRLLNSVLNQDDVDYIKKLYKEQVLDMWEKREQAAKAAGQPKPRRMLEYFTLLKYFQTSEKRDERLAAIFDKLYARVEKEFGSGFIIANDFWSWRAQDNVAAERVHMDADFWNCHGHDGFNFWILLDHTEMPYAFDIYTKEENTDLYKWLNLPNSSYWMIPEEDPKKAKECPGIIFHEPLAWWPVLYEWNVYWLRIIGMIITVFSMKWWIKSQKFALQAKAALPTWAFVVLMKLFGWTARLYTIPAGIEMKTKQFPIGIGDALVVRQHELHGTDCNPLKENQCRLAIGFKFMRQGKVGQYSYTSPASKSRRRFPGLRTAIGKTMPDVYRQTNVDMKPVEDDAPRFLKPLFALAGERFTKATKA